MNKADFVRNFNQSYFGLVSTNPEVACLFSSATYESGEGILLPVTRPVVDGNKMHLTVLLRNREFGAMDSHKVSLPWYEDIDTVRTVMRTHVPAVGMIQGQHTPWYVSRIPVRDTPRGYAPRYCRKILISDKALKDVPNGGSELTTWRVFNKQYFPWNTAIELLESGQYVGVAVDRFLALAVAPQRRYIQIHYKDGGSVGHVINGMPVLFAETATDSIREYVKKLSGITPTEK